MSNKIWVQHNMEVAHRLSKQPGKCQNIHGHSMMIRLVLSGDLNEDGILEGWDFADIKKTFRGYIDRKYDHHILLWEEDEWAQDFGDGSTLPGLTKLPNDPTTENLVRWIGRDMQQSDFGILVASTHITETGTNGADWYA